MASLSLKNVCKVYPNGFVAVKDFNLEIADQEFIIFVGPSGCGKSTTLRMIAGLEEISSGELWIGDKMVNDVEPKDRDIAMVFQNYALYPHMSVYDNMAFGLKLRKVPEAEIDKAVHEATCRLRWGCRYRQSVTGSHLASKRHRHSDRRPASPADFPVFTHPERKNLPRSQLRRHLPSCSRNRHSQLSPAG